MSNDTYIVTLEKHENIHDENGVLLEHRVSYIEKQIPVYLKLEFEDQFGVSKNLKTDELEIDEWINQNIK